MVNQGRASQRSTVSATHTCLPQVLQPSGLPKDVNVSFLGSQKSHVLREELVRALKPQVHVTLTVVTCLHCMAGNTSHVAVQLHNV